MDFLVVLALCLLATSKVTVQGFFAKRNVKSLSDSVLFNCLVFLFSALLFVKDAVAEHWSVAVFGTVFGILTVVFQLCYIRAMALGNVSLTVMMVSLSMIIPTTISLVVYNERLSFLRLVGIALTVVALVLSIDRKQKSRNLKKWLLLSVSAFLCNGGLSVCQKVFGKTDYAHCNQAFVAWSYIVATLLSVILYRLLIIGGQQRTFKLKPSVFLFALAVGVILGIFQALNTKAIAEIDGVLLFPTYNGLVLIFSTVSGLFILRDKLKINQITSLIIGVVALVFMSI